MLKRKNVVIFTLLLAVFLLSACDPESLEDIGDIIDDSYNIVISTVMPGNSNLNSAEVIIKQDNSIVDSNNYNISSGEEKIFNFDDLELSDGVFVLEINLMDSTEELLYSFSNEYTVEKDKSITVVANDFTDESSAGGESTIYVPSDYNTIQGAINAASAGDVIEVEEGTYIENINFLGKDIVLRSTDPTNETVIAATIIDGNESGSVVTMMNGESNLAVIKGFTIKNGTGKTKYEKENSSTGNYGGGIYVGAKSSPIIKNNIIKDNKVIDGSTFAGSGAGIFVESTPDNQPSPIIENNLIENNIATNSDGGGISLDSTDHYDPSITSSPVIRNNTIKGNSAREGSAIFADNLGIVEIDGNLITENEADYYGAIVLDVSEGSINNNEITNNIASSQAGISIQRESNVTISNNTIDGNEAIDGAGGGIFVNGKPNTAKVIIDSNTVSNNLSNGKGAGVYLENASEDSTVIDNSIENNIASGQYSYGGGVFIHNSSPEIKRNIINNNISDDNGGGIYADYRSAPVIDNNEITNNTGLYGGGINIGNIDEEDKIPQIINNTISGNEGEERGGGILIESTPVVISDNDIVNNTAGHNGGGGIYLGGFSGSYEIEVSNNLIDGNSQIGTSYYNLGGGGIYVEGDIIVSIFENDITNNSAYEYGGGIFVDHFNTEPVIKDENGSNWIIGNYPPNTESANNYSGNSHNQDPDNESVTGGEDIFFFN